MQWEFTADDVVRGDVAYDIAAFRRDLLEEVRANLTGDDDAVLRQGFDTLYDLCYWLATGRDFADFAAPTDGPFNAAMLHAIRDHMEDNIVMLGAILQRMIMDGVERGLPLEEAVEAVAQRHAALVVSGPQIHSSDSNWGSTSHSSEGKFPS